MKTITDWRNAITNKEVIDMSCVRSVGHKISTNWLSTKEINALVEKIADTYKF